MIGEVARAREILGFRGLLVFGTLFALSWASSNNERNYAMKNKKIKESEDVREMRESIEEMERELKGMDQDIAEAKEIPDPEMREIAVKNLEQMRESTREMIASFRETYKVMLESEAEMSELIGEVEDEL